MQVLGNRDRYLNSMRIAEMTVGGNDDRAGDGSLRNAGDDEAIGTDDDGSFEFAELYFRA
jgi:hypothetical protein